MEALKETLFREKKAMEFSHLKMLYLFANFAYLQKGLTTIIDLRCLTASIEISGNAYHIGISISFSHL